METKFEPSGRDFDLRSTVCDTTRCPDRMNRIKHSLRNAVVSLQLQVYVGSGPQIDSELHTGK